MKLNLGSHDRIIPGYDNMDFGDYPVVKYKGDVSDLSRFMDGSIEVIRASHILEHFSHTETVKILKEWRRVLAPNGLLYISVPDFDAIDKVYHLAGLSDWIITILYGDNNYDGAQHKTAFNFNRLCECLKAAGFSDISQIDQLPHTTHGECCTLVDTITHKPISVNVLAIK